MAKGPPPASRTTSPASLLEKNADGALLIKMKPQVYTSEMGCTMMVDDSGNTFSQLYYVISFSVQQKQYYTIWGVRFGKGPPLTFDSEREYRFLVKPYREADSKDESVPCEIIKVWDGGDVVFEKEEKKEAQPRDALHKG